MTTVLRGKGGECSGNFDTGVGAGWYRFEGVEEKIVQQLPQLHGVSLHQREIGAEAQVHLGRPGTFGLQSGKDFAQPLVEVEGAKHEVAAARIGEHLTAEVRGSEGRLAGLT